MDFKFDLPVDIRFGSGIVKASADALAALGKRAYVVTGANSGRRSGALADVMEALASAGVAAE
ncbi:MAG: iron-containing alcohol dehydrogenase, partial [Clostridia bacterium]|nr:iron-containing alcohol dehydrogenase [Clostridia bacterium]